MSKNKKTGKWMTLAVIAYGCIVLMIASVLLSSGAKYRAKITGRTSAEVAEFNAVLLDSLSQNGQSSYVSAPLGSASNLLLSDCYPGMAPREYPFIVANGTDTDVHATDDIEFAVRLRSMCNIPLKYSLILVDEFGVRHTYQAENSPIPVPIADEHESASDTDWREYSFYPEDSLREQYFRLSGSKLSVASFILQVEWPIESIDSYSTADARYMNEVEVLDVLAKVSSAVKTDVAEQLPSDRVEVSAGLIIVNPELSHGEPIASSIDVGYTASLFGFRASDTNVLRYDFEINNGNYLWEKGINFSSCTDYSVSVLMPWYYYTKDIAAPSLQYTDVEGHTVLVTPTATDYRKYDLLQSSPNYGSMVAISPSDLPSLPAATATDLQYRYYLLYTYDIPAEDARLINRRKTDGPGEFSAWDQRLLALVIDDSNGALTALQNNADAEPIHYRYQILVHAAFTEGATLD